MSLDTRSMAGGAEIESARDSAIFVGGSPSPVVHRVELQCEICRLHLGDREHF